MPLVYTELFNMTGNQYCLRDVYICHYAQLVIVITINPAIPYRPSQSCHYASKIAIMPSSRPLPIMQLRPSQFKHNGMRYSMGMSGISILLKW